MSEVKAKGSKPWWWKRLWIGVLLATIGSGAAGFLLLRIPLERAVTGVALTFLCLGVAYYVRVKPSRRVNRGIYILLGISPIGFALWIAYVLTVGRYVTDWVWPSLIGYTVPYIIGAFIGDWIGKRRNYRLPLSIE